MAADLLPLLQALLSPVEAVQKPAEVQYEAAKEHPQMLLAGLLQAAQNPAADPGAKQMAAVLLRKLLIEKEGSKGDVYGRLPPETAAQFRPVLLQLAFAEGQPGAQRRMLAEAAGALGSRCIEKGEWPELLPALGAAMGQNADAACSALTILGVVASCNYDGGMKEHMATVVQMFCSSLGHASKPVRVAAAQSALLMAKDVDEELAQKCGVLVAPVLQTLSGLLNDGDTKEAQGLLTQCIEVADDNVKFFTRSGLVDDLCDAMLSLANGEAMDEDLRMSAVQLLISLTEEAPKMAKKVPRLFERLVPLLMAWCLNPPEGSGDEWGMVREEDDEDEKTMYECGSECVDRLSCAVGGKALAKHILAGVAAYTGPQHQADWHHQYAALWVLLQSSEGCEKQFSERANLQSIVALAMQLWDSPHPRVRYAALRAVAQFCSDLSPEFQKKYCDQVLPAIVKKLQDPVPRIRHLGALALVNFTEDTEEEVYAHHVEGVLGALHTALCRPDEVMWVREQALSTVATFAETAPETFMQFYDKFTPIIKQIFEMPETKEARDVKGKAIKCAGWMAMAAGKERFSADSEVVLRYMHSLSTMPLEADDPRTKYLTWSWTKVIECVGEQFLPYIDAVFPFAVRLVAQDDEAKVFDKDEEPDDDEDYECIKLKGPGEKKMAAKTSILEEKYYAIEIFEALLDSLGHTVAPRVQMIFEITMSKEILQNMFDPDIRQIAAKICPLMVKVVKDSVAKGLMPGNAAQALLNAIVPKLVKALKNEEDTETADKMLEALHQAIDKCSDECLTAENVQAVKGVVGEMLHESLRRCEKLEKKREAKADDDDEEELECKIEEEEDLLINATEVIATMVKTHPVGFMKDFVETFLPSFVKMLQQGHSNLEKKVALFVLCDFVCHGGQHAAPYFSDIVAAFLHHSTVKHTGVSRACAWGLGVCAEWADGSAPARAFAPGRGAAEAAQALKGICAAAPRDDATWAPTVCNAASAMVKLLKCHQGQPGVSDQEILPFLFTLLPVHGDDDEAQSVHRHVFGLVAQKNPLAVGPGGSNMPAIVHVAQQVLVKEDEEEEQLLDDETRAQVDLLISQPR